MSIGGPHTRLVLALLAGTLALAVVLSGCGGNDATQPLPQSRLSAGPTSSAPGYRTWFPHEHVRFRIGQQVRMRGVPDVLHGFITFQVGTARALRTGQVPASVRRHSTHAIQQLVRQQVDFLTGQGVHLESRYRVDVRTVARRGTAYALQVCVRQHGSVVTTGGTTQKTYRKKGSVGVLLARGAGLGRWRVTDYEAMKKPLQGC